MSTQRAAMKEAITQILSCALQGDSDIQRLAEERKKALEVIDDYPFILTEIIQSQEEADPERHMAAVFLKNYLHDFYTEKEVIEKHSETLGKLSLRLLQILPYQVSILKAMICQSLALLIYKGLWPCIDNKVMSMMQNNNDEQVFSAIILLKQTLNPHEFYHISITSEYFEVLLNVFQKNYPSDVRLNTISPMCFLITFSMVNQPNLQRDAIARLNQLFDHILNDSFNLTEDLRLKTEVIKGLLTGLSMNSEIGSELIIPNLPAVGEIMTKCCEFYKKYDILSLSVLDDHFDAPQLMDLLKSILKLVNMLIASYTYRNVLLNGLDNLLYCLFVFIACFDNSDVWDDNDDDEKTHVYTIRNNAADTLTNILVCIEECKVKTFFQSLHNVFQKHINECGITQSNSNIYSVRIMESLMYGLGVLRNYFSECTIFDKSEIFPHSYYLESWSPMVRTETDLLLLGRLFWLASRYSATLSPNTLTMHLKALSSHFLASNKMLYTPCAVALKNHLEAFQYHGIDNRNVITNLANELALTLFRLYHKLPNKPKLFLISLGNLFKYNENVARIYANNAQDLLMDIIIDNFSDVSVLSEAKFLIGTTVMHKSCELTIHESFVPFLMKLIYTTLPDRLRGRSDGPEIGLEFLNTIIIYTPEPVHDILLVQSFDAAYSHIMDNVEKDANLNEAAANYLATLMVKYLHRLKELTNNKGVILADYVPKLLFEFLNPVKSVWTSKVGRFCVISIMSLIEQFEPNIELILKSVLSSFQVGKANDLVERMKGLMFIFAYIFMCRPENTMNFLSSIPGPNGGSALSYLFNKWHLDFVIRNDKFEKTILAMAITQIIRYAIDGGNTEKMCEITVTLPHPLPKVNGIEFLYYLLVHILISEYKMPGTDENEVQLCFSHFKTRDVRGEEQEETLFKCHPCSNIDIESHIKAFLKNLTPYYFTILRSCLLNPDMQKLQSFGVVPDSPME